MNEFSYDPPPIDLRESENACDAIETEVKELYDLLARKNRDYGSSAFKRPPFAPQLDEATAILVRIGDKIERLQTLAAKTNNEVQDESFRDTIRDLAGYCVLWLVASKER